MDVCRRKEEIRHTWRLLKDVCVTAGVCVYICGIKRDLVQYRGINYCVIGLSQPRYVMLNLVAKSTRERGRKKYKLL